MQLSDKAIEAYSKLTLADCARVDCALIIRTVSHLHNAALNEPGGVPEEFDAIHAAFNSLHHSERNQAFRKGQEEAEERRKAKEGRSQTAHQLSKESKVQNAINNKPIYKVAPEDLKKKADVLTVKEAERIQFDFIIGRMAAGKQSFTAEVSDSVVRRELTQCGILAINPVDREIGGSNVERWKQTAATARQNLKNDGLILWSVRAQRWIIPLTEQDLKKEAKKRVEHAPVRILQIKRTGT